MDKIFKILLFLSVFLSFHIAYAKTDFYTLDYLNKFKEQYFRYEQFNSIYYNALELTPEQIAQYEDLAQYYKKEIKKILENLTIELQKEKIVQQKCYVKKQYKNLEKIYKEDDKILKNILNREQRSYLRKIKHLERHDLSKKSKNFHKLNPKMSVFGNLQQ